MIVFITNLIVLYDIRDVFMFSVFSYQSLVTSFLDFHNILIGIGLAGRVISSV